MVAADLPRFRQLVRALSLAALAGTGRAGGPWAAGGGPGAQRETVGKPWENDGKMMINWHKTIENEDTHGFEMGVGGYLNPVWKLGCIVLVPCLSSKGSPPV